jgi:protein tyrosine phosphatase (PTP) superfamily phosphohydrolase (DUF442 family)
VTLPGGNTAVSDEQLQAIYNYRLISERISTSGMPTEAQLADIAQAGFEVVINLDQLNSRHALPDERGAVEALGLAYWQIPVLWENPTHANWAEFQEAMAQNVGKRVFIHCVANARVSVFVALYRILELAWSREDAMRDVHSIWTPNDTWQRFIESELCL